MGTRLLFTLMATLTSLPSFAGGLGGGPSPWCVLQAIGNGPPPTAQSIFPFSVIRPGGTVIVLGQHFGPAPGQLFISFNNYQGVGYTVPVEIISWADTVVVGTIPKIQQALPQRVGFSVSNMCGVNSATSEVDPLPAEFTPDSDLREVLWADISCKMTSNNSGDTCMANAGKQPLECTGLWLTYGTAPLLFGYDAIHMSGWGNGNQGTDTFSVNLQNFWTIESMHGFGSEEDNGGSHTLAKLSVGTYNNNNGDQQQRWSVNWSQDSCSFLSYQGFVTVKGPLDTPY